jgi:plasmid stabilization system protein ParE
MTGYRFTPEAAADLLEIWSYIARDSIDAADRVESAIYDACIFLAQAPLSGQVRKQFTARPVRFWTVQQFQNYLIVYRPETRPLKIIRILHGRRDVRRILR